MAKSKTVFSCSACGNSSPKWMGKCTVCGEFNTFMEETIVKSKNTSAYRKFDNATVGSLADVKTETTHRLGTGFAEVDRVLGGGVVPGSLILIGGEPGAGKSTISLQIADNIAQRGKTLYVSGEE